VVAAIAEHDQNLSAVARALGLHRSQLYRLLDQYGIRRT
jgi:ActR/RegA family two-component response regulator